MAESEDAAEAQRRKTLKAQRKGAKAACTRAKTFIEGIEEGDVPRFELLQRQSKFQECWQTFEAAQSAIELFETSKQEEALHNIERLEFEGKWFAVAAKFEELIAAGAAADAAAVGPNPFVQVGQQERDDLHQPNSRIRLPQIELPKFSGSYEDWHSFHDVFHSMIHENAALPTVQKMHYLKASLKGEAADVISSLELSAENYVEAWEMLKERYDNQRVIVQKHIKAIFDHPPLHKENHVELRQLLDTILKHLRALKVLKRNTDKWDDLIVHVITSRLAPITNKEWETSLKGANIPTLKDLTDFLAHRCRALEAIDRRPQVTTSSNTDKTGSRKSTSANLVTEKALCQFCKGDHPIFHCSKFLDLSIDKRFQEIKALRLCINCLKSTDHRAKQCNGGTCKKCNKRHNTLLHTEINQQPNNTDSNPTASQTNSHAASTITNHVAPSRGRHVLLSTAVVRVEDARGRIHTCRALLDNGSQSNFVTTEIVKKLGLRQVPTCVPINGVGDSKSETRSAVKVSIQSRLNGFKADINCLVLHKITQDLPSISLNRSDIRVPPGITLADPEFLESSKIDMLIGVEIFWDITCIGQIKATDTQPCWQKTQLGWIAAGRVITGDKRARETVCNLSINDELNASIKRFWEIEDGTRKNETSLDERKCEKHFSATVKRNSEGRFIVQLPVKREEMSRLGESKDIAMRRFKNIEKRLSRNPALKKDYADFMHEYLTLGHMRQCLGEDSSAKPQYYLPHHCVIKEENTTTKLRVVFDASCKTTSGMSLNDALMSGPVLQQDLFSIIARFRTFKYVLIADIAKMYRQVIVDESQVSLQRIIWRDNVDDEAKEFELLTVTYGTSPASFLAIKCLQTLAEIESENFPLGSKIVLRDFYVDDLLTGSNSKNEALQIREETTKLLEKGGFVLRKWATNTPELLEDCPHASTTSSVRPLDKEASCKTLGIQWNPNNDVFQYSIMATPTPSQRTTKRAILSCIAQIFDPLGLLGPVIVAAKMLIQKLWTLQLGWDESLPANLHTQWIMYKSQISQLNELRIPRRVIEAEEIDSVEIHGFCDASEDAYGACVYIRITDRNGTHQAHLLCSKSRVAPLKAISLPRLELCGAQLLAQLIDKIIPILDLQILSIYCWTDATIVIDWIRAPSRKFNTFVANRVGEIQELTGIETWHHVSTHDNPADILSRGVDSKTLMNSNLWWCGPQWLKNDKSLWPRTVRPPADPDQLPEQKRILVATMVLPEEFDLIDKFSSYERLVKITAMCCRFAHNARSTAQQRTFGLITPRELETARKTIVKRIQAIAFCKEIEALKKDQLIKKDSHLIRLNPFLDKEGLLRVGGRLRNAELSYAAKHPLVVPAHHRFTQLVIEHEHKKLFHAGPQATLGAVRTQYWPLGARGIVRTIVHKCVTCFKARPRVSQQIMGDLPAPRVTPSRPFSNVGVDYCGPIFVREGKRRNAKKSKAWIAIFVCLATKAVHIELVSDLTTDGFLNALKRFIGRRGKPSDIYSDNGTNFVGANRELEELRRVFNQDDVRRRIVNEGASDGITWHFIPPRAPHFGGLWEAAVKSMKHHLVRVVSDGSLTFEEVTTLLTQIEAILNSRPLTPLTSDPEDCSYLTPGHFLIGDSLISYPEPNLQQLPVSRLSRWQRLTQIRQHFWQKWSIDYLHQLQQRTKWKTNEGPSLQLGQLVMVRENNLPPQSWLIGRVVTLHPGPDEVVRTATVKTSRGTIKRPATKLCIVPIET